MPFRVMGKGFIFYLVRPERFELPTAWFEARNSVQLSYGRKLGERKKGQAAMPDPLVFGGEPRWDRTNDHLIKSQVLYRLS
jgi:hypothetical protein